MFTMRNDSLHRPSDRAEADFRRLSHFNKIILGMMIVLVILGVWNIIVLAATIRSEAVDLADSGSIMSHISSRLIILAALVTLALYLYKEWKWGEFGFSMAFFLGPLLFLTLVPVMSAEVEPAEESMVVKFTLNHCAPGGIEGGEVLDSSKCTLVDPADYTVYMTDSEPVNGDQEWLTPDTQDSYGSGWQIVTRGRFLVYFVVEQPSLDQCNARISTSVPASERRGHHCLERDGKVWLVQAFETSAAEGGRLIVYQEFAP